jgi:hypothetical protein
MAVKSGRKKATHIYNATAVHTTAVKVLIKLVLVAKVVKILWL